MSFMGGIENEKLEGKDGPTDTEDAQVRKSQPY